MRCKRLVRLLRRFCDDEGVESVPACISGLPGVVPKKSAGKLPLTLDRDNKKTDHGGK
jgi:hypothetical protein